MIHPLLAIRTEDDYDQAVEHLNQLVDAVGLNEAYPLYELLDLICPKWVHKG